METEWLTPEQCDILDVARHVLVTEGSAALTIGRLARELATAPSSLREHFDGLDEVLRELTIDGLIELTQALRDAGSDFGAQAEAYRRYALEHAELYRLMTEYPFDADTLPDGLTSRVAQVIAEAVGADLADAAWAFAHGMVELELDGRFSSDADLDAAWRAGAGAFAATAISSPSSAAAWTLSRS